MKKLILAFIICASTANRAQSNINVSGSAVITCDNSDVCADTRTGSDGVNFISSNNGTWCNSPLPVEIISLSARLVDDYIHLYWQTATEVNNHGFEIERNLQRTDGSWQKIGFVEGYGNSNSTKEYNFTDKSINGGGKFQYRLKQIDTDGSYSYSETIEVIIMPAEYELSQNYPNPFNPATTIKYSIPAIKKPNIATLQSVSLKIYDILGNEVATLVDEQKEPGYYQVEFNASQYTSGVYIYILRAEKNFISIKKMLLIK